MGLYRAELLRIVDGDTMDFSVTMGHRVFLSPVRVRLAGVGAPESRGIERDWGKQCTAVVEHWLALAEGEVALIDFGVEPDESYLDYLIDYPERGVRDGEDAFRRWLCQIRYGPDFKEDLGAQLISQGYAVPYAKRKVVRWAEQPEYPLPETQRVLYA